MIILAFIDYITFYLIIFKKPKYDTVALAKALYHASNIKDLERLGINSNCDSLKKARTFNKEIFIILSEH